MPSLKEAQKRHAKRFLKVVGEAQDLYTRGYQQEALVRFDQAWGQIQQAWDWAKNNYESDRDAQECIIWFPGIGGDLLTLRHHPKERIKWLELGLSVLERVDDNLKVTGEIVSNYYNHLGIAYKNLGELQISLQYQDIALNSIRKTEQNHLKAFALMAKGVVHKNLGDFDEAINLLQQALKIFRETKIESGHATALMNLGIVYYRQNQLDSALEYYQEAEVISSRINDQQSLGRLYGNQGRIFQGKGDFERAIECYQWALGIAEDLHDLKTKAISLQNIGLCYLQLGRVNKALDYHEQSLKFFQKIGAQDGIGRSFWNISICLHKLDRIEDAIESAKNASNIFQKIDAPSMEALQNYLLELQRQPAHSVVAHAIYTLQTNTEQTVEGHIKRGDAHRTLEQFEVALRYYDRAIRLAPDCGEAHLKRGDACFFLGRFDEAIADFTRSLQFKPNSAMAYGKRGSVFNIIGHFDKALEDQKRAIELDPKFVDAYYNAGIILMGRNVLTDALPYFEKAAELGDSECKAMVAKIKERLSSGSGFIDFNILQEVRSYSEMKRMVVMTPSIANAGVIDNLKLSIEQISEPGTRSNLRKKLKWLQKAAKKLTLND